MGCIASGDINNPENTEFGDAPRARRWSRMEKPPQDGDVEEDCDDFFEVVKEEGESFMASKPWKG
jgi:hypothetical protein